MGSAGHAWKKMVRCADGRCSEWALLLLLSQALGLLVSPGNLFGKCLALGGIACAFRAHIHITLYATSNICIFAIDSLAKKGPILDFVAVT